MGEHAEMLMAQGYTIFQPGVLPDGTNTPAFLDATQQALAGDFEAFSVVDRDPLWRPLSVDIDKESHRFGGVGYNPLHIDFVNTTKPPDYLALACVRNDPLGGGHTMLAPVEGIVAALDEETKAQLRTERYTEGKFFGLSNVGEEYQGFPILDDQDGDRWLRFTAKMLPPYNSGEGNMTLARKVDAIAKSKALRVMLRPGDVAVIDQRQYLHGREALGEDRASIAVDERRLLYEAYFRRVVA